MDADVALREFERLARRLGIEQRYTSDGSCGLCTVKGRRVLFLRRTMTAGERLGAYAEAFRLLDIEDIHVPPVIRHFLGNGEDEAW